MAEASELISGIGELVARIRNVFRAQMAGLPDLEDPQRVPAAFLDWLGANVGLDPGTPVGRSIGTVEDADVATWRRLIPLAMSIWRAKGTPDAYGGALRAVLGARSWLADWFVLREITDDTTAIAITTADPASETDSGAYRQHLHVEDVDGTLDRELAALTVGMVRQMSERVDVTFVHLVETWTDAMSRWTDTGTVAVADGSATLGPDASDGGTIELDAGTAPAGWTHAIHTAVMQVSSGTTGRARFRFHDDGGGAYYEVSIDSADGTLRVARDGSTVATAASPCPLGVDVLLRVMVWPNVNGTALQAEVNGSAFAYYEDATPRAPDGVSWVADAGTVELAVRLYEVSPGNPEIVSIGGP